jgi:thiol-disulfide isomerase/thioredoxin
MRSLGLVLVVISISLANGQKAEIIKLDRLQKMITQKSDNIQVVNFWATWCAPCVKELPLFEKFNNAKPENVKITLVSMDLDLDPNPDKVYKFIDRKKIMSEVLILDEKNPNDWIDKIEKQWTGALPATMVINQKTGKRKFVEKELHEGDLENLILEVQKL